MLVWSTYLCLFLFGVLLFLVSCASSSSASLSSYSCAQCFITDTVNRSVRLHSRHRINRNNSAAGLKMKAGATNIGKIKSGYVPALGIKMLRRPGWVAGKLKGDPNKFQIMPFLTLVLLNCFRLFFVYLKLELLTQFPASNDEKHFY